MSKGYLFSHFYVIIQRGNFSKCENAFCYFDMKIYSRCVKRGNRYNEKTNTAGILLGIADNMFDNFVVAG